MSVKKNKTLSEKQKPSGVKTHRVFCNTYGVLHIPARNETEVREKLDKVLEQLRFSVRGKSVYLRLPTNIVLEVISIEPETETVGL